MSADEDQSLSAEELRKRLYQSFKKKGVLDAVKTQLRNQLIVELQRESLPQTSSEKSQSLSLLASNSLVIQHLQSSGYEYTLSVFYPECGISKEKVFSTKDILQLLRISPESRLYKHLVADNYSGQKGLLINLLSEFIDQLQSRVCDADTQTSDTSESIVRKMQVIDEEYELLRQRGQRWASVEVKLAEYRKQMEEQAEAELKSKIQHFQEVEISRVRMEEREKYQQELMEVRRQLERNYEMKSEALMNREKNAIERLQRQQQIEDKEMYSQRQALLKEIESVHHREAELRHKMETFQKSCKLHEEKMRSSEELLRKRELDVRKMEEMYDLKLNGEIRKHQLELNEDYSRRTEALTESENRNKGETARIQREAAIIDAKREEHQRVMKELARVQEELALERGSVCVLEQQNAALKEKLEGARDYTTIRNERMELQAEVHLLKKQLEESQEEKRRLQQELNTPSPELLRLQEELKRLEAARRLDQEEVQNQKQVFHSQLSQEVERCAQLKAQLLECEERTRWMSTHTEDLKQQLRRTQQALENEVLRNPKPSLVDPSVLHLNPASVASTDVEGYLDHLCDPGLATRGRRHSQTEGEEAVAAALNRIQELEKEAESLEEAYRSYRRKGVVSQIPLKATSSAPACAPVTFFRPIAAAKTRVVAEEVYTVKELNQHLPGHMTPPTVGSPPLRRLSSTPVSTSKTKPRAYTEQVMFSGLSSQREVSPIPMVTSEEYTHITPPSSPQLKSTARDNYSPKLQMSSSQESSPQPEKISIQDLTAPQTDFPDGLEQHQQMEETHTHMEQHDVVQPATGKKQEEERRMKEEDERRMKEEEEERWQEERRLKEERRLREREEAQERERTELERLQLELQEDLPDPEEEEKQETGGATEIRDERSEVKTEAGGGGEGEEVQDDPLHRYMLMVMQGREREREQKKDESESPEPIVLSDHKDDSITAFSHEDADDFW
ncbi:centriole and centriolar satellite protein ofd1 isoform X2 [Hemibagrus wyckioides]|uniref:centriole and centriolar satellite protein ofd1 isoform X2 n=1 Tax=Hemibagrus wyckioides TaxID=337641 RepID=UPI00266B9ADC|nr:centriole and centriolar satellite protein ofd1 isoform X2 [Hemibagrus wyckioides]